MRCADMGQRALLVASREHTHADATREHTRSDPRRESPRAGSMRESPRAGSTRESPRAGPRLKVHLRSISEALPGIDPVFGAEVRLLRELAQRDVFGRYELTEDPIAADLLLFVESARDDGPAGVHFEGVRRDPLYRRFRDKAFLYSALDWPVAFVPGVFPSIERGWCWRSRARSGAYFGVSNPHIAPQPLPPDGAPPHFLASFVGCTSKTTVRYRLLALRDPAIHVVDNTAAFLGALETHRVDELERLKREFAAISGASRFILCPRGRGVSSIRLFEAMQMGRVPVVLADGWVPPDGPDWNSFLVRVRERDIDRLPDLLRELDPTAAARAGAARLAWEAWFAPEVLFHRICDACHDMLGRRVPLWATQGLCYLHFLRPLHGRRLLRETLRRSQ